MVTNERSIRTNIRRATPEAQNAWQHLTRQAQKVLIGYLGDYDKDGVANGFDCRPKLKKFQEDFLPDDKKFVSDMKSVKTGKLLGRGCVGEVYNIKGNDNLVVKLPRAGARRYSARKLSSDALKDAEEEMKKEAATFQKYNLTEQPLFVPTKVLTVEIQDRGKVIAMIRPKVKTVTEYYPDLHIKNPISDKQLRQLRDDLIILSEEGFCFVDGLQLGIDRAGRVLIYDIGFIEKEPRGSERPYRVNDYQWQEILETLGKQKKFGPIAPKKKKAVKLPGKDTKPGQRKKIALSMSDIKPGLRRMGMKSKKVVNLKKK